MTNLKGTIAWMAPEVIKGVEYSQKCDVYSWAVILWEMLTRKIPFEGKTWYQVMFAVAMSDQRPPEDDMSECYLPLQQLVKQSWQKNVEARPRMKEIVDSLVTLANNIKNAYCKQISDENPAEESFSLIEKQTIQKEKSNKCKQKGNQRQTMLGQNSSNVGCVRQLKKNHGR